MIENVKLAGRDWPVPILSIKQNRIVVPAILKVMPLLARLGSAISTQADNPAWLTGIELSTESFDLIADIVYMGLTRGTPGLARAEFDNLEISTEDLLAALPVVAKQTGLLKTRQEGTPETGEAQAATAPSTSISLSSPSASAQENLGQTS